MDINKRITELKQEFKSNANLRYEWDTIRNSEAYRKISELVFLESAASLSKVGAAEHDIVAARRLFKHQSVQEVFQALNQVHIPEPESVPIPPAWEHINVDEAQ
jgi:hypothetical protein